MITKPTGLFDAIVGLLRLKSFPPDTRILPAEDNLINQRVTMTLIKKTNITVDVVSDGKKPCGLFRTRVTTWF